jgi:hypothetical protein
VVIVAAAGNDGSHGSFNYPSSLPGVLSVGAHDAKGELPYWTNWGPSHVPIYTPGANIVSTVPRWVLTKPVKYVDPIGGEAYAPLDGTSMASPYGAMLAGFVRTFWPQASESEVWDVMVQSADIPTLPIAPELQHYRVNAEKVFDLAQNQKTFKHTNHSTAQASVKINSFRSILLPPTNPQSICTTYQLPTVKESEFKSILMVGVPLGSPFVYTVEPLYLTLK